MSTSSDFLIELAGRLHHEPDIARRLTEIAHELRRLQAWADEVVRAAIIDAREAEQQAADGATADLIRICKEHRG